MTGPLAGHGRFPYSAIGKRPPMAWPNGARLAVYLGFNLEHFAFGDGLGAGIAPASPQPDVLNHAWREYGNRVGVWRCLDLFDELELPTGAILNTALYDHCPEVIEAFAARGDELIAHGHTNSQRQGGMPEAEERALIEHCRDRMGRAHGQAPEGWLSPWISESATTPDLLQEAGYRYTLNWCHDDQPTRMATRHGALWSVPYPQELNDIPMIIGRQMDAKDFAQIIIDQFDEMLEQGQKDHEPHALVMGIALHPYIVGQPYRLRHLRRALRHIVGHATITSPGEVWITTPGRIADAMDAAMNSATRQPEGP
ncbi:polysaccharide deacetylase family protein [soil metagenome]